ncbi:putative ankyrin repeat protein [Phaeoacremonium minimum UCRPA7]|uniref:Putative ankyrin repeat protein n=1 Tax=Phaeoacremonium minimum (strain UCR-PA7) TaxID=1286976 RepID=R8BFB1_PHAM7|nr:putative ankyrin repeat protein [Phaeoacremonium minimum UCRPA7]EON97988.1 putative ankyrin repeat protein [Phaeoacremonium minimum UCRPA7]
MAEYADTPLTELLQPYRKYEAQLRQLYAQEPEHELVKDPHANLLPLFTNDTPSIKTRARNLGSESEKEKEKYIMALPEDQRRPNGSPATVQSLKEFQHNFSVFSESSLIDLDWNNVVAAGSSVVNCLLPVPEKYSTSKRVLREFYHEKFSPASDVDLFLYGLSEEEAIEKIKDIETRIRDSILTETTTVRTKNAITICSQYPTRHVQIVLRIYKNVSEILTGLLVLERLPTSSSREQYLSKRREERGRPPLEGHRRFRHGLAGDIKSIYEDEVAEWEIGSFNPLTDDDWTEMSYVGNTARLCQAIVDGDLEHVEDWLAQEGADPNKRDYTGRTPLHLAVISSTPEVVKCLVDHGARLISRLADGKTALHLAAARGDVEIVKILMEKSTANEAEEEEKEDKRRKVLLPMRNDKSETEESVESDEDEEADSDGELVDDELSDDNDGNSMATGSFVRVGNKEQPATHTEVVPDEVEGEPDFYHVDAIAWDKPVSALHLAVISGHTEVVKLLCQEYGADVLLPVKFLGYNSAPTTAILTMVLATALPVEKAKEMVKTLLSLGSTSAQADIHGVTAFQRYAEENASELLEILWEMDKIGSNSAINHLGFTNTYRPKTRSALQAALQNGDSRLALRLLDAGAVSQIDFDTWLKSAKQSHVQKELAAYDQNKKLFSTMTEQPLIAALKSPSPEIALELIKKGVDVNIISANSHQILQRSWWRGSDKGQSALDVARDEIKALREYKDPRSTLVEPKLETEIDEFLGSLKQGSWQHWTVTADIKAVKEAHKKSSEDFRKQKAHVESMKGVKEKQAIFDDLISTFEKVEAEILARDGKTFDELHPDFKNMPDVPKIDKTQKTGGKYEYEFKFFGVTDVTEARMAKYIELFEASWEGDLEKIKSLTLQSWDKENNEPPLQIAVNEKQGSTPFSLALLRGHLHVAKAILEIVHAQYSPTDKDAVRYDMEKDNDYESDCYSDSASNDGEIEIYSHKVDEQATIENIGQVSMQVKSHIKPQAFMAWETPTFTFRDGKVEETDDKKLSPLNFAIKNNDQRLVKFLLDLEVHYASLKFDKDDEPTKFVPFPDQAFLYAIGQGRTEILAYIIKRTGAGIPLEELVKTSGVEIKEKPRYYQGLTVYGKKRKDWANAGRNAVSKPMGTKTSPLLLAAKAGSIESVEWFLTEAPLRQYIEFSKSKVASEDSRLKHLNQTTGGFEKIIRKWLSSQNELVLHAAVMGPEGEKSQELVKYLIKAFPSSLETKSVDGRTPLNLACYMGRPDLAEILIKNGADQSTKTKTWDNLLHSAVFNNPKAEQLRPLLDLLDANLRSHMFRERNSLQQDGKTPLHSWISGLFRDKWNHPYNKSTEKCLAVLKLLLEYSEGRELDMLDGAGDTPLHTLIAKQGPPELVRAILDVNPQLLYRENAVGRTPLEISHEGFLGLHLYVPEQTYWTPDFSVSRLVTRAPKAFVGAKTAGKVKAAKPEHGTGNETDARKRAIWQLCDACAEKYPSKRRLVSLHEANDVARRLGETYQPQRYLFKSRREKSEEEEEEEDAERAAQAGKKKETGPSDFATETLTTAKKSAWQRDKPRELEFDSDEELSDDNDSFFDF